jgi:hypothetical protein
MRSPCRRVAIAARVAAVAVLALGMTTPSWAQFGGLKKRLKSAAGQEGASKAADAATGDAAAKPAESGNAAGPGGGGGMIVLTQDVVDQLLAGLKAGQAERAAAAREDTPYGRYTQGAAAYKEAEAKCQAAQQTFPQRMAGNQKVMDKYSALVDKMVAAQAKPDPRLVEIYQDSAMAMQDPSCIVKRPEQPKDYYEAQRDVDARAEKQEIKGSGLSRDDGQGTGRRDPQGRYPARGRLPDGELGGSRQGSRAQAAARHSGRAVGSRSEARAGRGGGAGHRTEPEPPVGRERLHDPKPPDSSGGARSAREACRGGAGGWRYGTADGHRRHAATAPDGRLRRAVAA